MSRHEFMQSGVTVAIGWDAPLSTFYLQVWNEALHTAETDEEERESPKIWFGTEYAEQLSPGLLIAVARQHLPSLPGDIEATLLRDRIKEPARPLSPDHAEVYRMMEALLGDAFPVSDLPPHSPDEIERLDTEAPLKGASFQRKAKPERSE